MGMKEGTRYNGHRVLERPDESLQSTPDSNTTLHVNHNLNLERKKKHVLGNHYVLDTVLGSWDTTVNRQDDITAL